MAVPGLEPGIESAIHAAVAAKRDWVKRWLGCI